MDLSRANALVGSDLECLVCRRAVGGARARKHSASSPARSSPAVLARSAKPRKPATRPRPRLRAVYGHCRWPRANRQAHQRRRRSDRSHLPRLGRRPGHPAAPPASRKRASNSLIPGNSADLRSRVTGAFHCRGPTRSAASRGGPAGRRTRPHGQVVVPRPAQVEYDPDRRWCGRHRN